MDFSERKCSGDGLGNKKGLAIYLKTVAKLISKLSVFIVLGWRKRPAISADGQTNKQTGRGRRLRLRIRISITD